MFRSRRKLSMFRTYYPVRAGGGEISEWQLRFPRWRSKRAAAPSRRDGAVVVMRGDQAAGSGVRGGRSAGGALRGALSQFRRQSSGIPPLTRWSAPTISSRRQPEDSS
jgi:hypothetical protein